MLVLKKYGPLLFFINLTLWTSMASTPFNELFGFSHIANQIFSILLYFPFLLAVLWKLIGDLRNFRKTPTNLCYYIFMAYYAGISVYRLLTHGQLKENIYYAIVFLGSMAIYTQFRDNKLKFEEIDYQRNFFGILLYVGIFKFISTVFSTGMFGVPRILGNPPVNNLYSTSILMLLLPFMVDQLKSQKKEQWKYLALLTFNLFLIAICNSRAIFLLALGILAILLFINIRDWRFILKLAASCLCTTAIVAILLAFNVASIDYSISRVTGLSLGNNIAIDDPDLPANNEDPMFEAPDAEAAQGQIEKSDAMRSDLLKLGIAEFFKNPLIGTGELMYSYDMGYKVMEQSAHNFIIESLVCFGLIGTLILAVLLLLMLIDCGYLKKKINASWQLRISALLWIGYYFIFGMVQPSVYNALVCPIFAIVLCYYGQIFRPAPAKELKKLNVKGK